MRSTGAAWAASRHPRRGKAVDKAGCATAPWRARSARFTHRHPIRTRHEPDILLNLRRLKSIPA